MSEATGNPVFDAQEAYRAGEGQDANPYQDNMKRIAWAMEMHRLQWLEMGVVLEELSHG